MNLCSVHVWGILRDQAYGNHPHTEDKLKESIQNVVSNFTGSKHASGHVCLQTKANHFQHQFYVQ